MISTQRRVLIVGLKISAATLYVTSAVAETGITSLTLEQLEQQQATLIQRTPTYVDNLIDSSTAEDDALFADADPERLAQHRAIKAHMAAHNTDYQTAARAVVR